MQEEMRRYSAKLREAGNLPIEARVGVNTGEAVVRSIATGEGHAEYTPIGHSTSLAARMQTLAPTGSTAVTDATRKLCEGYFTFKPLGPTRVKGVHDPVNVHEVTGLGPLRTRLQRAAGRGFTKFVGRQAEMEALARAGAQARAGRGQIVAAVAEPGVGKSRLFYEFKVKNQSGWMVLEAFSVSHGKASAYLPVIDLLHGYFRITGDDDSRMRREKVMGRLLALDRSLEDALPYLFGLLGLVEDSDPLVQMGAQMRRRRTLDAIKRIVLRESLNQPLMLMFEDLHWIDDETQALLNLLADSIGTAKVLLMVNYRPQYTHSWGRKTYYTRLRLDPLGQENADEMLSALVGDGPELVPLRRLVLERTEGNPFFIEELVQALFDEGVLIRNGAVKVTTSLSQLKIPPTVQAILTSRIDRLPPDEKELLQTLAVIGREFPLGLIRAVTGSPDDRLEPMLSHLQLGEFVYELPAFPDVEYTFKHALTQEVAYNSVLMERRKLLHERAGEGIEALFAEQLDDHLNELAHHYGHSPNIVKAVKYLQLAGQQAAQRLAYDEAVSHLTSGLELLASLPDNPGRARRELELQLSLVESLRWTKSLGSPETRRALIRARELCGQVGESTELFAVLMGLQGHHQMRLDLEPARELGEQLLALAEGANEPAKLMFAHAALGLFFLSAASSLPPATISSRPVLALIGGRATLSSLFTLSTRALALGRCGRSVMRTRRLRGAARRSL